MEIWKLLFVGFLSFKCSFSKISSSNISKSKIMNSYIKKISKRKCWKEKKHTMERRNLTKSCRQNWSQSDCHQGIGSKTDTRCVLTVHGWPWHCLRVSSDCRWNICCLDLHMQHSFLMVRKHKSSPNSSAMEWRASGKFVAAFISQLGQKVFWKYKNVQSKIF